jgi:signal transduction histidine kinase
MRRWLILLFWPSGLALGLAAEWVAYGWDEPLQWMPDLAVGWVFIGFGLTAHTLRPHNNTGALMAATGFSWFLGNFAGVDSAVVASLATNATYLHRGFLVHLLVAYPIGRLAGRPDRVAVATGYATALISPVWRSDVLTIILATLLILERLYAYRRSAGRTRRARLLSVRLSLVTSSVLVGTAVAGMVDGSAAGRPALMTYQGALVFVGGALFFWLCTAAWEQIDVADLVVELGERDAGTLRAELSRALADPSLEVGYWSAKAEAFLDASGNVIVLPDARSARGVTVVRRRGQPVAALLHDPAVLDDPGLLEAVSAVTQLAATNARLQTELQSQVDALSASRRRVLLARDEQRKRLERRLHEGAEGRLERLAGILRRSIESTPDQAIAERLGAADEQLQGSLLDMRRLARGLHPRILEDDGLAAALSTVADGLAIPVHVEIARCPMPGDVEAAAYFVCSEALANVAKYARASKASVSVTCTERLVIVSVEDDGVGGADFDHGTGLRGLADRVETLGGTFAVRSEPGAGTLLTAEIPLAGSIG